LYKIFEDKLIRNNEIGPYCGGNPPAFEDYGNLFIDVTFTDNADIQINNCIYTLEDLKWDKNM